MNISIGDISSIEPKQGLARASGPDPLFNNQRHKRLPGSRWEVSPGYHLWGERKSGEQNALPLLVTGDRQARKPANDGIPHTAVEVLTELANDLVSGAGSTHRFTDAASMRRHWKSTEGKTMSNSKFQVRDLHKIDPEGENEGVHDILFTGAEGVIRYSDDVYESAEEAQKAIAALEAAGELPDWWEVFTPTPHAA